MACDTKSAGTAFKYSVTRPNYVKLYITDRLELIQNWHTFEINVTFRQIWIYEYIYISYRSPKMVKIILTIFGDLYDFDANSLPCYRVFNTP